jgi:hypothetical protein
MRGKLGRGAFFALLTAAAIAGCSKSQPGITVIGGSSGDLNNPANVPNASTIAQNNLADDTGAFSNNGQTFLGMKCAYNSAVAGVSSGANGNAADDSAMILFLTNDAGGGSHDRLYATHFEHGNFTVPVEISGVERDETKANDVDLNAAVMVPLNVGGYADPATGQSAQAVSRNKGNWVILWTATTRLTDPGLRSSKAAEQAVPLEGPRRTIYYTLFQHSLMNTSSALSDALGKPNAQTTAGTPQKYEYGFLTRAQDVIKTHNGGFVGGAAALDTHDGSGAITGASTTRYRPAEDVMNFGVATDALIGVATFLSQAGEPILPGQGGVDMTDAATAGVNLKVGTSTPTSYLGGVFARPVAAVYQVGDATSFLRLFFVQLTSSRTTAGDTYTGVPSNENSPNAHWGGPRYRMFSADYDLDAQDFKAAAEVGFPASRPAPTGASAANCRTQPSAQLLEAYNGHFFWSYLDASLASDNTAVSGSLGQGWGTDVDQLLGQGTNPGQPSMQTLSRIQAVSTVVASSTPNAGVSTIAKTVDLTLVGSGGVHLATAASLPGGPTTSAFPSTETNTIGPLDEVTIASGSNTVFGTDNGLVDTTVYFVAQCNSIAPASGTLFTVRTSEIQLCAAGIDPKTGSLVAGSPRVLSKHDTSATFGSPAPANQDGRMSAVRANAQDSVIDFKCAQARDGSYILTLFRHLKGGTVQGAEVALEAIAEQSYTDSSLPVPGMDVRFSALQQVNTPHPLTLPTLNTGEADANFGLVAQPGCNGNVRVAHVGPGLPSGTESLGPRNLMILKNNKLATVAVSQLWQKGTIAGDTRASAVTVDGDFSGGGNLQGAAAPAAGGQFQGLKSMLTKQYAFQDNLAFVCGVQSDVTKMNVLWTTVDGTDDGLYIANVQTTIATTGAPTPTVGTITEKPIVAPALVGAPAIYSTFDNNMHGEGGTNGDLPGALKSTFNFIPGSLNIFKVHAIDLGVDATQPTGVGGGALVFFWRLDDATDTDGDYFDAEIYAAQFDGTTVSPAVRCARSIKEDNPVLDKTRAGNGPFAENTLRSYVQASGFLVTQIDRVVVAPKSNSLSQNGGGFSADYAALIFTAPSGDSGPAVTAPSFFTMTPGLFVRHWDETIRRSQNGATTTLDQQFTPPAGVGASKATDPIKISRDVSASDLLDYDLLQAGKHLTLIFLQDAHLYVSQTDDGKSWSADSNGDPNPPLFDNNTTSDFETDPGYFTCKKNDSNCDNFHGSISLFAKKDINGTMRAFVRTWR